MFGHWGKPTRYMEKKLKMKNPKTGDFLSRLPFYKFIMVKKNIFGVLLMKSEYGQINVVSLL